VPSAGWPWGIGDTGGVTANYRTVTCTGAVVSRCLLRSGVHLGESNSVHEGGKCIKHFHTGSCANPAVHPVSTTQAAASREQGASSDPR
jgi:hypothetical protein